VARPSQEMQHSKTSILTDFIIAEKKLKKELGNVNERDGKFAERNRKFNSGDVDLHCKNRFFYNFEVYD
jgi:hypothetical protein